MYIPKTNEKVIEQQKKEKKLTRNGEVWKIAPWVLYNLKTSTKPRFEEQNKKTGCFVSVFEYIIVKKNALEGKIVIGNLNNFAVYVYAQKVYGIWINNKKLRNGLTYPYLKKCTPLRGALREFFISGGQFTIWINKTYL